MILYKTTNAGVRSPDGDIDLNDIVAGVLIEDTLALHMIRICLDYKHQ